jgi:FAD dependent oxidoreductase TIGR03364
MTTGKPKLVVVGGGVIGTMHALWGLRHGYTVEHLERDALPRGASVRNFGLVWVGGRAQGKELELALRAREQWEAIGAEVPGTGFRAGGSLTIASRKDELAVMQAVVEEPDASTRGFHLLSANEARAMNPALGGDFLAALWCELDAIVEPRLTLGALREHLRESPDYEWLPRRHIMEYSDHAVIDHLGAEHRGDLVVCCIGASPGGFLASHLANAPLRRVRLQMLETTPVDARLSTSVADGDSLRYYPAYAKHAEALLEPQDELARTWGAQLLMVQRLGGHLTIGDTHAYDEPFAFDVDDEPYEHLLGVACRLLDRPLAVARRWDGIYSQVTDEHRLYYRQDLAPGVVLVTGPGGRGMTMSPAIAEETFR